MIFQKLKHQQGFTLIEMMIVMLVISVILIITIPNVTKHNANITNKGCNAYVNMVQAQVQAYQMENNKVPTIAELESGGYLNENVKPCTNGKKVSIDEATGKVTAADATTPTTPPDSDTPSE